MSLSFSISCFVNLSRSCSLEGVVVSPGGVVVSPGGALVSSAPTKMFFSSLCGCCCFVGAPPGCSVGALETSAPPEVCSDASPYCCFVGALLALASGESRAETSAPPGVCSDATHWFLPGSIISSSGIALCAAFATRSGSEPSPIISKYSSIDLRMSPIICASASGSPSVKGRRAMWSFEF